MTPILLFSLAALLCYIQTKALECNVCKMLTGCRKGTGMTCEALPGQQCMKTHVFKVKVRDFTLKGCTLPEDKDRCNSTSENQIWGTIKTKCCNDKDHCNE